MFFIQAIITILPSFLRIAILRFLGAKIGKGTTISFGSILLSKNITIGQNVRISPFALVKSINLKIDDYSVIKSLTMVSAREIDIEKYTQISFLTIINGDWTPNSYFKLGDHSRVFPFCWLDTGEGIRIGKQVGIGGHTLIFTHGVWTDYIDGGPVTYKGVEIEDNVWLPWRVFVMPGVKIGAWSIIGANAVVNKSIPSNSLAAGSPAKIIKENIIINPDLAEKRKRMNEIFVAFTQYYKDWNWTIVEDCISCDKITICINNDTSCLSQIRPSLIIYLDGITQSLDNEISIIDHKNKRFIAKTESAPIDIFVSFIRRFGIRLYKN